MGTDRGWRGWRAWRGWRGWRGYAPDAALAAALAVFVALGALLAPTGAAPTGPLSYLLLLTGPLALVARRRAPVTVLLITTVCLLGYQLHAYPESLTAFPVGAAAAFPLLVAVYTAVRAGRRLAAGAAVVAVTVGVLAVHLAVEGHRAPREVIQSRMSLAGWLIAGGVMAEVSRQRAAYLHQVEQRAAEAERTREETALRRAGEERLRIARELHDSLTHSISIIKVQAGVAVHLARKRGDEVPAALVAIQEASGEAMRELRATLEVLRRTDDERPGSGLDRLPDLIERARSTGLPATVTVSGQRHPLPAEIDRAAYRIVQEALTNITRHAGPAAASVHIGYGSDELTVQIDDDGRAGPDPTPVPGIGLIGMRERVTALGGRLVAGPRPEGGFRVRAQFPVTGFPAAALPATDRS